jgi:hypothetical protein
VPALPQYWALSDGAQTAAVAQLPPPPPPSPPPPMPVRCAAALCLIRSEQACIAAVVNRMSTTSQRGVADEGITVGAQGCEGDAGGSHQSNQPSGCRACSRPVRPWLRCRCTALASTASTAAFIVDMNAARVVPYRLALQMLFGTLQHLIELLLQDLVTARCNGPDAMAAHSDENPDVLY